MLGALYLEVHATRLGLEIIKPPKLRGASGVEHPFSFLASGGKATYAFDVYDGVTETDVLKSFIKKFDTRTPVNLICTNGKASPAAVALAKEYDMKILKENEIAPFFDTLLLRKHNGPSSSRGLSELA